MAVSSSIPWYDDWWTVKPNEFERGVLTGMLLACGQKGKDEKPQQPESSSNWKWYKTPGGVLIETWTYSQNVWERSGHTWDKQYIKQRKTYSDGTFFEYERAISTYYNWGIPVDTYDWEFIYNDPDSNGCIGGATVRFTQKSNPDYSYGSGYTFKWNIPTTEPKVIT